MQPKPRWLIEGVCGTGKSSMIAALTEHLRSMGQEPLVITEDDTFGELMAELQQPSEWPICWRLDKVLNELPAQLLQHETCILERFHPSYYAQVPKLSRYQAYDQSLASLGFTLMLLDLPDESLRERSLYRWEREAENWIAGNIAFYGSEAQAIEAFQISQQRRREYARLTQMTVHILDTTSQDWEKLVLGITQPEIHVLKGLPIQ